MISEKKGWAFPHHNYIFHISFFGLVNTLTPTVNETKDRSINTVLNNISRCPHTPPPFAICVSFSSIVEIIPLSTGERNLCGLTCGGCLSQLSNPLYDTLDTQEYTALVHVCSTSTRWREHPNGHLSLLLFFSLFHSSPMCAQPRRKMVPGLHYCMHSTLRTLKD